MGRAAGPCPKLEARCSALLNALGVVENAFDKFWNQLQEQQLNQSAAEWRGTDEKLVPPAMSAESVPELNKTTTGVPSSPDEAAGESCRSADNARTQAPPCESTIGSKDNVKADQVAVQIEVQALQEIMPRTRVDGPRV